MWYFRSGNKAVLLQTCTKWTYSFSFPGFVALWACDLYTTTITVSVFYMFIYSHLIGSWQCTLEAEMRMIRNNWPHALTFPAARCISNITLCRKARMYIQTLNNRFASKTSYGSKNVTDTHFRFQRINSELFKSISRPPLLKRKNFEVIPQDYLVPVSLKSGDFVLCFMYLWRYLAFTWLVLHLHCRIA